MDYTFIRIIYLFFFSSQLHYFVISHQHSSTPFPLLSFLSAPFPHRIYAIPYPMHPITPHASFLYIFHLDIPNAPSPRSLYFSLSFPFRHLINLAPDRPSPSLHNLCFFFSPTLCSASSAKTNVLRLRKTNDGRLSLFSFFFSLPTVIESGFSFLTMLLVPSYAVKSDSVDLFQ